MNKTACMYICPNEPDKIANRLGKKKVQSFEDKKNQQDKFSRRKRNRRL